MTSVNETLWACVLISSGIGLFIFVAWWFLYPPEDSA